MGPLQPEGYYRVLSFLWQIVDIVCTEKMLVGYVVELVQEEASIRNILTLTTMISRPRKALNPKPLKPQSFKPQTPNPRAPRCPLLPCNRTDP